MLTSSTSIILAAGVLAAFLIAINLWLAVRHDHVTAAAPKYRSLDELDASIEEKRNRVADIEADLQQRREALANIGDIQAEYDQLKRQRDELLVEWASLDEKRAEVRAVREETEASVIDRQSVLAELSHAQTDLEGVRERLERAERLEREVEHLNEARQTLQEEVDVLRPQLDELKKAQDTQRALAERSQELEKEVARAEGALEAATAQLNDVEQRVRGERESLALLEAQQAEIQSSLVADRVAHTQLRETIDQAQRQLDAIHDQHANYEARLGTLEELLESERKKVGLVESGRTGAEATDPLAELNTTPPVLLALKDAAAFEPGDEADALRAVSDRMKATGLAYSDRVLRAYHTAMKVNETTQMTVLAGISGTGKSQFPRVYAAGMGIGFLQVPVQPRWDSPQDLMGFYN